MSKAVLISIRPKWCEKIVNGNKTIEVRKTRPKLDTPFKCYIYCTRCGVVPSAQKKQHGKVIGEFTCDRIDWITHIGYTGNPNLVETRICDAATMRTSPVGGLLNAACLTPKMLNDYLAWGDGYGWHISDLRIYDETRELSEFTGLRNTRFGAAPYDIKRPMSKPMSFWTEQDVLHYLRDENIPYCSVYGDIVASDGENDYPSTLIEKPLHCTGCQRTGCMFCGFGAHLEKGENRFERMKHTHPKHYDFCIGGGEFDPADGLWKPNEKGLGYGRVLDFIGVRYRACRSEKRIAGCRRAGRGRTGSSQRSARKAGYTGESCTSTKTIGILRRRRTSAA